MWGRSNCTRCTYCAHSLTSKCLKSGPNTGSAMSLSLNVSLRNLVSILKPCSGIRTSRLLLRFSSLILLQPLNSSRSRKSSTKIIPNAWLAVTCSELLGEPRELRKLDMRYFLGLPSRLLLERSRRSRDRRLLKAPISRLSIRLLDRSSCWRYGTE